jgi:hypothetical protein
VRRNFNLVSIASLEDAGCITGVNSIGGKHSGAIGNRRAIHLKGHGAKHGARLLVLGPANRDTQQK